MAYDQPYYHPPAQRPYDGPAAPRQRPPPQDQQQQYPPQGGYDQYQQDGYYDNGYDNGYGQDYNGGYQDMNGGGRGNAYPPPQAQNYPPQQEYYGEPRGGGGLPPPNRGRGGPMQRPPTSDGIRGGYDQRGGGQGRGFGGMPPAGGRGGRPPPLDRNPSSDPGSRAVRKPLKTPPMSPPGGMPAAWDNPFPTFPGAKKKTNREEENLIVQKMAAMDMGGPPQKSSRGNQGAYPPGRGGAPTDDYGRPSMDSQRSMPRGPPQGFPEQRRGPPPGPDGYPERGNSQRSGGYGGGPVSPEFGPPGRSMTMPNQPPMGPQAGRPPPMPMEPIPNERPYNGPIGRAMPPRPSTASGMRQPPQRMYPNQAPVQPPQQYPAEPQGNLAIPQRQTERESVSDFYDAYYDTPEPQQPRARSYSQGSEMPNFDLVAANTAGQRGPSFDSTPRGGASFDQQNSHPQQVQPDPRGRAQPQAAVFEMADGPGAPNNYQQGYDQYNGPPQQSYGGYQEPAQGQFPLRSTSAATRGPGLPSGGPRGGGPVGLPNGGPNGMPKLSQDALPAHPAPVRAGLIPNSVPNMAAKPPPVRNYGNMNQGPPNGAPIPQPAAPIKEAGPPPVTVEEIEKLRNICKTNPTDQVTMLNLAKRLVEASEVLVPAIPDQKQRNKSREKYVMEAFKLLKKLTTMLNPEAMFYLADCYGRGALGLETDNKEAFTLYQSAAKAGHAAAAYRTAVCCELGNEEGGGTRKDPMKAIQWYKRAATLGDPPAMYKVGMILLKGLLGQPKNPREAVGWLKRAAERADVENPHALHELGLLYEQPQGPDGSIVRDEQYSFNLFQQAADLGYKFSQFRLGSAYEYGLFNCPIDPRQSIMWYSRAAVQEEHQSELALSGWYLTGSEGVLQQSDTEAYLWARKAAMAGNAKAEYAMGYFTEVGIGIPANLEDAKRWYWRAAAQNFPKARERLEDLKRGGKNAAAKGRERISRSKVGKQQEGECSVM